MYDIIIGRMCTDIGVTNTIGQGGPARTSHPNVFVRGIPLEWSEQELVSLFENFGRLTSVRLVRHSTKKSSLGYGFVRYERVDDAALAIEALKEVVIGGHVMHVKLADSDAGPPATSTVSGLTPCDSCYVKHVPAFYTKEHVIQLFSAFGVVIDVKMYPCLDAFRGSSSLVKMDSVESAAKAVHGAHGMKPDGSLHSLVVRFAESAAEKQARLGRKEQQVCEGRIAAMQTLAALSRGELPVMYSHKNLNQEVTHPLQPHGRRTGNSAMLPPGNVLNNGYDMVGGAGKTNSQGAHGDAPSAMVAVSNLAPGTDRLWLYEQFSKFGSILLLTLDGHTRCAQIVYKSVTAALEAKNVLDDTVFNNHRIRITLMDMM